MPFRYKIIHEKKVTFVQASDVIDLESSIAAMMEVVSDKEYNPDYKAIVDLSKTNYDPQMKELFRLRDSLASLRHKINNEVIVISKKELLSKINMVAFLAKVFHIEMSAVDHYEELDELEDHLTVLYK